MCLKAASGPALRWSRPRREIVVKPLRVGVVGTAYWAREVHASGIQGSTAELAGVWGRNEVARQEVAAQHGVRAFRAFRELLDAVDIVTFAVPPAVQPELAIRAAEAGKHVILEKPIALGAREAEAIAEAVSSHEVASLVFFTRRFVPEITEAIAEARRADWAEARVVAHNPAMATASPFAGSAWRQEPGSALWSST